MTRLGWTLASLLTAAVAATGLTPGAAGRAVDTLPSNTLISNTLPSIYVDYSDDCVFTMHADGGLSLTSTAAPGTTVPPGEYEVVLRVPQNAPTCPMRFQLQGPGVQLSWDFGGEALNAQATEVLQPGATYTATDLRDPNRYRAVFTAASTGSSSSLVTQTTSSASGTGQTLPDLVGSGVVAVRGSLAVAVSVTGAVGIDAKDKAVHSLVAGRYHLTIADHTPHSGLTVRGPHSYAATLSGVSFVGKRTTTIALTAGTWRFSALGGTPRLVVVR